MLGRVFDFIAVVVTVIWAVSVIAAWFNPNLQANPAMYALLTSIVGAYAGARVLAGKKTNGNGNGGK